MLRVSALLCSALLSLASAVDFKNSIIITSADVQQGVSLPLLSLIPGDAYRVYATFASGNTEDYARNVRITDDSGATFNVAGLSHAKPGTGYILDDLRILRAPITVQDANVAGTRVPFTIYIVHIDVTRFPVVSAQLAGNDVDSSNGFLAAGLTILSAEKYFTMYKFDIGSMSSMAVSSVGFDESSSEYEIMKLSSPRVAGLSFISVYGPIATLFNANFALSARFRLQLTKNIKYDFPLSPGASYSLLSPGYLSKTQSYNVAYDVPEALQRAYQFQEDNFIEMDIQVRDVRAPENIVLRVTGKAGGVLGDLNIISDLNTYRADYASGVSIQLQNSNSQHTPRFLFQLTSSSSLTSLFTLLLITFSAKML